MNTNNKLSQVFTLLQSHKLSLLSLVETKLSTYSVGNLQDNFATWHIIHNNDAGSKNRILILLNKSVRDYEVLTKSQKHIT